MMNNLTPMMKQYLEIKEENQDCILFFRLGDFYEMFFEDAIKGSAIMEIALTKKNCGIDNERAPMCGVPYHSAESYIAKLIGAGLKVAICEQVEDPKLAKGIVKREVIRIITPGTLTGETMLSASENNYLVSVFEGDKTIGLAFCDISTGELSAVILEGKDRYNSLLNELVRIAPSEIIIRRDGELSTLTQKIEESFDSSLFSLIDEELDTKRGNRIFSELFSVSSPKGLGIEEDSSSAMALYDLLLYLDETQKQPLAHLGRPIIYNLSDHMMLDKASIRNLELTETLFEKQVKGSLLGILDKTRTAMGGRKIKKWLKEPLIKPSEINSRLNAVEFLIDNTMVLNNIREFLKGIYDLERLAGRVSFGNANGRDLIALKSSISAIPEIVAEIVDYEESDLLSKLAATIPDLSGIQSIIENAIVEEPPFTVREGGMVKPGFSTELDELKDSIKDGRQWIASLEGRERERTGIKNLKVGYNKVFGYYISISNSHKDLIPEDYIRKQTLVNAERYITPELKEVESVVLGAETKINQMEYEIFTEIRETLKKSIPEIQIASDAIAQIDVLASFAEISLKLGYVKPRVDDGDVIEIEMGRHPVIEQNMRGGQFVPNNVYIDGSKNAMLLITGPNMAGKSTYMRMCALIVLMAQIGCFVPADAAKIGACDRLYTRIGASDNLAKGESTFYVEMSELAYILNTSTPNSLIILDEIGRGTSTYDGLAIAWAVLEYLCEGDNPKRTLFATHYHELTVLEGKLPGMKNLHTEVSDSGGEIIFLHRISEGSASRSYGIHVAKLAGVPQRLLDNAEEKLEMLESERKEIETDYLPNTSRSGSVEKPIAVSSPQISMFDFAPNPVVEKIKSLNILEITPSQAFSILEELKKAADEE